MRKPRNSQVPEEKLLHPFDVTKFGSDEDPCFGKLYDLTTPECQRCGDHELCAIAFVRVLKQKREDYEEKNPVKDLEISNLERDKNIKAEVETLVLKGFSKARAVKKAAKKFHIHSSKIKQIAYGQ